MGFRVISTMYTFLALHFNESAIHPAKRKVYGKQ